MDGHIQLRRGLMPHLKKGKMTMPELSVYVYLHYIADFRTGVCLTSAPHIYYETGQTLGSARSTQRILESLEKKGYIRRLIVPGRRGDFHILIHKYQPTFGVWKGKYLNALESESSEALVFISGTDDGTESGSDGGTRDDRRDGEYVKNSGKNSKKNSFNNSKRSGEEAKAKAGADARACALSDTQISQLIRLHGMMTTETGDYREVSFETVGDVDPLRIAHVMCWAYRTSRYADRLNGIKSFLKGFSRISASYEDYQSKLAFDKPRPEEALPTLDSVLRWQEEHPRMNPNDYASHRARLTRHEQEEQETNVSEIAVEEL